MTVTLSEVEGLWNEKGFDFAQPDKKQNLNSSSELRFFYGHAPPGRAIRSNLLHLPKPQDRHKRISTTIPHAV